jgi:hypothetical protein
MQGLFPVAFLCYLMGPAEKHSGGTPAKCRLQLAPQ